MAQTNGWGLIGTGRIAEERVLPGITACEGNRLVGIVSRDPARAEDFRRRFGAEHAYTRFEDLLANPAVTVVAIHTPNSQHAQQTIAAARAGKHVFCDKPIATSVEDAIAMVEACERAGVTFGVNFQNRFLPAFHETRRIIDSGEIGDVLHVQYETSSGNQTAARRGTWRLESELAGLGATMSIGVHGFDILRYLLDSEVETVSAMVDTPRNVMEGINLTTLRFQSGVLAHVAIHERSPYPHNDIVIYGTKGRIRGHGITRSRQGGVLEVTTEAGTRSTEYPATNGHAACIAAFSRAIAEGRKFTPGGLDGLRSVQLTEAIAKSAWDGVHVDVA